MTSGRDPESKHTTRSFLPFCSDLIVTTAAFLVATMAATATSMLTSTQTIWTVKTVDNIAILPTNALKIQN